MKTMDDFDFYGKRVLLRVDINSPVVDYVIQDSSRIKAHANTVRELMNMGAKVIILAHQGRPGDKDYTNLEQHAKLLSEHAGRHVTFVDDVYGKKALGSIRGLKNGSAILLDNVRSVKEELEKLSPVEFAKTDFIKTLSGEADVYVNDALAISHRANASVVGFIDLPCIAGRVIETELNALKRVENPEKPLTLILGGKKPEDRLKLVKKGYYDNVLTGGVLANMFLVARGYNLGKSGEFIENNYKGFLPTVKELENGGIKTPVDIAFDDNGRKEIGIDGLPIEKYIEDIGSRTITEYKNVIADSRTIFVGGTMGVTENKSMQKGTMEILRAVADSNAFSVVGGGHSGDAIEEFGIPKGRISYVSLSGGALFAYLAGEKLPGLEALKYY
ncbi:MAG: phosphoglycerate kinase [Candidatus Aenigmatarchaeota archaeon]